jgi:hypothetical protein
MKRIAALAVVISVAMLSPVGAFERSTGEIYSFNVTSCGQYAQDRKLPVGMGMHATDKFYIAGWLTALNVFVSGVHLKGDSRIDDVLLWLDRYCLDHPFERLQDGLIVLSHSLAPSLPIIPQPRTETR